MDSICSGSLTGEQSWAHLADLRGIKEAQCFVQAATQRHWVLMTLDDGPSRLLWLLLSQVCGTALLTFIAAFIACRKIHGLYQCFSYRSFSLQQDELHRATKPKAALTCQQQLHSFASSACHVLVTAGGHCTLHTSNLLLSPAEGCTHAMRRTP